jgi:hypothetical protein
MRAFHAGLETFVSAVGALEHIALWPREEIDQDADKRNKHHQEHPQNRAVHAPCLGVASYPNQKRDLERDKTKPTNDQKTTAATAYGATGGWSCCIVVLSLDCR